MKKSSLLLSASLCAALLTSCVAQNLQSESGLYNVTLHHHYKAVVDGAWTWGKGNPFAHQKSGRMYVAPLDISAVEKDYPELAPDMVSQMHKLMSKELAKSFREINRANKTQWGLTNNPAEADLRVNMAVVSLRTQRPGLWVMGSAASAAAPIPGLGLAVDEATKGDIVIEGTLRNNRTGELLLAFKDSNRAKLRFYHKNKYKVDGNVVANLQEWAEGMAKLCRAGAQDMLGDKTLAQKVEKRSWFSAFIDHMF